MFFRSAKQILSKIDNRKINIVGCGRVGREFLEFMIEEGIKVERLYDNNPDLQGKRLFGKNINMINESIDTDSLYILAVSESFRTELLSQLTECGLKKEQILFYSPWRDYEYVSSLDESQYKDEISGMFRDCHGYDMDWYNPKTYSEIICWEKLNIRDEIRTRLADKYLAREWVREKIGDDYLTIQYGMWEDPREINFDYLPNSFVLKVNNGSGRNIIVKDKGIINKKKVIEELSTWLKMDYYFPGLEYQYKGIEPRVICEELLDASNPDFYDCKIYSFHGKPMYIHCISDEHQPNMRARFYDTEWNLQIFNHAYKDDDVIRKKPARLEDLLNKTRILCQDFKHVRVDWFMLPNGHFLFSEMTFSSWGGVEKFHPVEYDDYFGKLIRGEA